MPENNTKVHYHLSANVQFDKDNAFNGKTNPGGSSNNPNIEKFSVQITYSDDNQKFIINNSSNEAIDFQQLKNYKKIMINDKLYELEQVQNGNNLKILFNCDEEIDNNLQEYFFYGDSKDNKGNTDKTFAGNTYNIFAENQTVEDKQIQQFYHGGSGRKLNNETKKAYNQDLIKEKQSFTLFYTRENIRDLNNENSILIGLGEIQNKIGVLDTSDRIEGSKIYCYNHYKGNDENKEYYLFRFPYQELIYIANKDADNKDSAKQFLEELIEPLSIENSDKPFFSKEQSKLISTYIVLKYANRLYEQIMKLKQNENLWKAVQKASKENNQDKWHFCDDKSIRFLKLSKEKLKKAQLNQKNPGLWALKDYFQINSGDKKEYENFLKMCSGENDLNNLTLFNAKQNYNFFNNFISNNLIKYPIANKKTIQRIFTHLGLKAVYAKKISKEDISTDLSELSELSELINKVNKNKDLYEENKVCDYDDFDHRKNALNSFLKAKNGFSLNKNLFKKITNGKLELSSNKAIINFTITDKNKLIINEILNNPYLLFEKYIQNDDAPLLLDDIDWGQKIILKEETDEAKRLAEENPFRLRAIVVEYIKKQENQSGHVWVSYEDAQEYLNDRLFELDEKLAKFHSIEELLKDTKFNEIFEIKDKFLTLKEFANRETYIKKTISRLIYSSHLNQNVILEKLEETRQKDPDNKFIESELSLLKMKELDFVFISGVAGSGKSHTLCKYLDYLAENKITDFQVLTPSGKAANVIKNKIKENEQNFPKIFEYFYSKSTKSNKETLEETEENIEENGETKKVKITRRVSTADRYIVDSKKFWRQDLFAKVDDGSQPGENDKIDILIIDEISMITLDTLYYILKIKQPKKLIILGDIKQLPPIGYGSLATSIYNHLFLESSFQDICLAKMETSHRADDNSLFIKHSLTLRDKEKQLKKEDLNNNGNFILIPYSNQTIGEIIKNIYKIESENIESQNIESENNNDPFKNHIQKLNKKIQILTPNRIGESGTYAINEIFKTTLKKEKEGLKFIYNKNDKETGLSNGTMGYYEQVNELNKETKKEEQKDKINFDDIKVDYSEYNENYELGFAITVHKSQGSGFPIVILVLPEKNNSLITKELIYTALTRPEEKMYILYHEKNIKALTQLPSIPHRNMNLFHRDKLFWIKDEIEYPITYNEIEYRRKQDLYFALMLEYSGKKNVKYHKNGSFVWNEKKPQTDLLFKFNNINKETKDWNKFFFYVNEKLLMPKFYIEEKQDEKSFRYLKSINLREVYENFNLNIAGNSPEDRFNENKVDIIEDNNDSIEITTHNGLRTRSWSEAILMLIFDNLKIPYFYEVEIRREKDTNNEEINTYKLTYPNPKDENYRIPDFTIYSEKIYTFPEKGKEGTVEIKEVKCIIEHLGMLSNEDYKKGWQKKVEDYYDQDKYNFDIVAPLRSLNNTGETFTISQKWDKKGDTIDIIDIIDRNINQETLICFTTDEKDIKDEEDIKGLKTLVEKLDLLKKLYFENQNKEIK